MVLPSHSALQAVSLRLHSPRTNMTKVRVASRQLSIDSAVTGLSLQPPASVHDSVLALSSSRRAPEVGRAGSPGVSGRYS